MCVKWKMKCISDQLILLVGSPRVLLFSITALERFHRWLEYVSGKK